MHTASLARTHESTMATTNSLRLILILVLSPALEVLLLIELLSTRGQRNSTLHTLVSSKCSCV